MTYRIDPGFRGLIQRAARRFIPLMIAIAFVPALTGCAIFGAVGSKLTRTVVEPAYRGLNGQSVAVMVAASPAIRQEDRRIQLDVAESLYNKLIGTQHNNAEELKGTTFPPNAGPKAIFAFQRNYPNHEWEPITTIAPKFGVTRLIHIEIDSFTKHPDNVPELYRGELSARVQVVEVNGNNAKVAYDGVATGIFPNDANTAGTPNLNNQATYVGTINSFTSKVVLLFIKHDEQEER